MYGHDPGLLEVLVLCLCVNTIEAKMEMALLLEEDGCEVDASLGCKGEGKSTIVTQQDCLSLLNLVAMYTPAHTNVMATFIKVEGASMVPLNGSPCRG